MPTLNQFRNSYPLQLERSLAIGAPVKTLLALSENLKGDSKFKDFLTQTTHSAQPLSEIGYDASLEADVSNVCHIAKVISVIEINLAMWQTFDTSAASAAS